MNFFYHYKINFRNETLSCRSYREDANDIREYWIENGYDKMIKEDPVFVVLSFWRIAECEGTYVFVKTIIINFIDVIFFYLY